MLLINVYSSISNKFNENLSSRICAYHIVNKTRGKIMALQLNVYKNNKIRIVSKQFLWIVENTNFSKIPEFESYKFCFKYSNYYF
jgi:hypothetical protein